MKKTLFHLVRYIIILLPIIFLIIVLGHTNYYTNRNQIVATNFSIQQQPKLSALPPAQLQNILYQEGEKQIIKQITKDHKSILITNKIKNGSTQGINLIPDILPNAPVEIQKQLDNAITHALLIKPDIVLQILAQTNSTANLFTFITQINQT